MKRKKHRLAVRLVSIFFSLLVLGCTALLAVRGDLRYRITECLRPARLDVLHETVPSGSTVTWRTEELLADDRVTVEDTLLLVNHAHPLSEGYEADLVPLGAYLATEVVSRAFEALRTRVERETGERLLVLSAYRDIRTPQDELDANGSAIAAEPGESEHETGLALDICVRGFGGQSFLKTAVGRLVNATCHAEGFIIRYPQGAASVTGFSFEPWHLRYVGAPHAAAMREGKLTLEEYIDALRPEQWYERDGYLILRSAAETVTLPEGFQACSVSQDGCGYRIYTVRL